MDPQQGSRARRLIALVVLAAGVVFAPSAQAQEAPICLTAAERLDDGVNNYRGQGGRDSVTGLRGRDRINGGGGNDKLNGGRDNDQVRGGPGDDILCGGRGTDYIYGGPGDDLIYGEEENDTIHPGPGEDRVLGSAGNDRVYGWSLRNGVYTDDGVDILSGGYNDDIVEAGGADAIYGHTHADVLSTRTPSIAPQVMDGGGNDDTIYGSDAADTILGGENGKDTLFGGMGDDTLLGGGNQDALFGGLGNDELDGGKGPDELQGDEGFDVCDGGLADIQRDVFDRTCELIRNRPRPLAASARRDGGAITTIRFARLDASVARGVVESERRSCRGGRKVSLFTYDGFISDKLAITYSSPGGRWRFDIELAPGRYFAKVDARKGCRYDVTPDRRI